MYFYAILLLSWQHGLSRSLLSLRYTTPLSVWRVKIQATIV